MWCHAMSDEALRNVVMRSGIMVWYMWNMVVCCDARCEMWLWNTEWCGMVWRNIRHGVMRNDGWNAAWDVWCGLECVLWDSGMCNLYLKCGDVRGMVWGEVECGRDVEWCAETWWPSDLMWNVVWCQCMWNVVRWENVAISDIMRLKCKMCDVEYGVVWNVVSWYVERCIMQDVESYNVMWNCGEEECGIWNVLCDCCVMSDVENDAKCDVRCGGVM